MDLYSVEVSEIANLFPEYKNKIIRLCNDSNTFRQVCTDYLKCAATLEYWEQSTMEQAVERRQEYEAFLADLEYEMKQMLNSQER